MQVNIIVGWILRRRAPVGGVLTNRLVPVDVVDDLGGAGGSGDVMVATDGDGFLDGHCGRRLVRLGLRGKWHWIELGGGLEAPADWEGHRGRLQRSGRLWKRVDADNLVGVGRGGYGGRLFVGVLDQQRWELEVGQGVGHEVGDERLLVGVVDVAGGLLNGNWDAAADRVVGQVVVGIAAGSSVRI